LPPIKLSLETLQALTLHPWPGNVRELTNVIEQAAIMSEGPEITPADLPFGSVTKLHDGVMVIIPDDRRDLKDTLKEVNALTEQTLIRRTLEETGENRTRAAVRLGISRRTLINKIQTHGFAPSASPKK
jgi:DNA-binding NtrC family response regulator